MHIKSILRSFLLKNKNTKQTIIKNTFWLAFSEIISKAFKFLLIIYVARILGATEYGRFNFALAFVSLFAVFSDFGLEKITTRELSQDKGKEKNFSSIISLKLILSLSVIIFTIAFSLFATDDSGTRTMIWFLMLYTAFNNIVILTCTFLRAREKMQYEALIKIFQSALITGFGFITIIKSPSALNLSRGYFVASAIALISFLLFFNFKVIKLKIKFDHQIWKNFFIMAWPVGLFTIFSKIYTQVDSVMMGIWKQVTEVGWYNASYRLIDMALIPGALVAQSFYPAISKSKKNLKNLQRLCDYRTSIAILMAIPLSMGGIVLAPDIINLIYGSSFSPSILALKILIPMGSLLLIIRSYNEILIILDQQIKVFWIALIGAALNIILNFVLIPKYSLYGAATSTLVSMLIMLFCYFMAVKRHTIVKPITKKITIRAINSILASAFMYLTIMAISKYNIHIIVVILISGAIYFSVLALLERLLKK
ncbi:flippase [Patescibacteria group bacterium]|nr:flippase [Patescibacteria group bacterium]